MRKIAFIGVGNMAGAIINGALRNGALEPSSLILTDLYPSQCAPYVALGAQAVPSPADAAMEADCIVLSVKPQNFPEILPALAAVEGIRDKLIISIAAGISTDTIRQALGDVPVVRVMPNTPMLIGMGVSALCATPDVTEKDFAFARSLFEASGSVMIIDEADMNSIISVTGSSPAYVFDFINAIHKAAVAQGLSDENLLACICDVVIGSATLLKSGLQAGGLSPEDQIRRVTSKGGTTEQAMRVLSDRDFHGVIMDAMLACTARAEEMGKQTKN